MKKLLLLCLLTLTLVCAKDSVEFKYAPEATERKFPTEQNYILSYNNILRNIKSSIVNISVEIEISGNRFDENQPIPQDRIQRALGSGVIISKNGYIVTNNHVVDGANKIKVSIVGNKKEYEAKLIGKDEKSDLAIIKVEAKDLNAITFYNSDKVKVGDIVFALGNPYGLGETITQGIVSATGRSGMGIVEYEDFIQTDASINPGNSGGALVNSAGYLIGINSAIISGTGGNVGIGFAIPTNMITSIATGLIENGKYSRAYLGVITADLSDDMSSFYDNTFGALITEIEDNTPASKAGFKRGDLIISINDKDIKGASDLKNTIGSYAPSKVVNIKFLRDKTIQTINVTLASLDNSTVAGQFEYEGIEVAALTSSDKQQLNTNMNGVLVINVKDNTIAQTIGIRKGDIIIQIEESEIRTLNDFKRATTSKGKKRVFLYRRGSVFAVVL
ncbi:MAG: trypsin-like peptidase domain-containing protein [Sulfurimonas sp.]|jgi:serine protease Do